MYIWQFAKWPHFSWRADALLAPLSQARKAQGHLLQAAAALGLDTARTSVSEILIEETVNTAAIEGEKFSLEAVRSSVARRLGLPTAGLPKPSKEIDGLVDVLLDATTQHEKLLTAQRLKAWQAALFPTGYSGLYKIRTGQWRGPAPMRVVSGAPGHERIHFEAPPHDRLPGEMKHFLDWWGHSPSAMDGVLRAAVAHFYFVTLHPFEDGNGRIARALTDMALAQDDKKTQRVYSLSSRIMTERNAYYETLERTQKGNLDITPWLLWFLECFQHALQDSDRLLQTSIKKAHFWHSPTALDVNARQRKVINKLLDAGPGNFKGGLTTRKYIAMTKVSRATAFREMSDLVEKKILKPNTAAGRSAAYEFHWEMLDK